MRSCTLLQRSLPILGPLHGTEVLYPLMGPGLGRPSPYLSLSYRRGVRLQSPGSAIVLQRWIGAPDFPSERVGTGLTSLKRERKPFRILEPLRSRPACGLAAADKPEAQANGVRRCMSFNALRLRFRLVASDFPGIVCILDGDRSSAVVIERSLARIEEMKGASSRVVRNTESRRSRRSSCQTTECHPRSFHQTSR